MPQTAVRIKQKIPSVGKMLPPFPEEPHPPCHPDSAQSVPEPEWLVSHVLKKFATLPADQTGRQISATLHQIVDSFRLDGCGLMKLSRERTAVRTFGYAKAEVSNVGPDAFALSDVTPWTWERLLNGNIVCFSSPGQLPPNGAIDRLHYEEKGIRSYLAIPFYVGTSVEFFFIAHHPRPGHPWPKETISLLRLIGELFVRALGKGRDRRNADPRLQFEQFISDISVKMINATEREVDREISATLEQVRVLLGFDRFGLLACSPDKSKVLVTHSSCEPGVIPIPEKVDIGLLFPWTTVNLLRGKTVCFTSLDELPGEAAVDRQNWQAFGVQASFSLPIHVAGSVEYLLVASRIGASRSDDSALPRLRLLGELFANALVRCRGEVAQHEAYAEIQRLKVILQSETEQLQSDIMCSQLREEMIGQSAIFNNVRRLVQQVAPTDSTVLVCGETGTGKELVAQAIHKLGMRRNMPIVKVNCASLPAALVESELFGREKGAYTGALTRQAGRFELADGGTIFLDEIAEMSLALQAKLLRVLQEGQFERLGSTKTTQVDVRVIAATNRDLAEEVRKGNFRDDLYYRLNVFQIVVPPLRERIEDIPLLTWSFVNEFGEKMGKKINKISRHDMAALQNYPWPGNIRELRNVVEHAVIVSNGDRLQVRLPENRVGDLPGIRTLEEHEAIHIRETLKLTGGRIKGQGGAAQLLGLNPSTLYSRMQKLGIINRPPRDEMPN